MIKEIEGNILDVKIGIICHQVNHQSVANSGLAKQIRDMYPEFISDYKIKCATTSFEHKKTYGTISTYTPNRRLWIASIFGQEFYGTDRQYTDYTALRNGFRTVRAMSRNEIPIYIPHGIGCGLGGGDWGVVLEIIEGVFKYTESPVTIIKRSRFNEHP